MAGRPVSAVPAAIGRIEPDPARIAWLWGLLIAGLVWGIPACRADLVGVSLALTLLCLCLGHSVGLHRGIIHRTYDCPPALRGVLAWCFVLSGLGSPLAWARLHAVRDYWQGQADCPPYFAYRHGLLRDFWWNLHCRFLPADDRALRLLPGDVERDRWLRFLDRTWPLHVVALAAVCLLAGGPDAVAVCVCARGAAGILGHWFVGYAAHAWGRQPWRVRGAAESGTNQWLLGVCSFGEGFHNNHHAFPGSARIGLRWWQVDLGWLALLLLRALGLVRNLRSGASAMTASPRGVDGPGAPVPLLARPA